MPGPKPSNRSTAEREIRAVQAKIVKKEKELDDLLNERAETVKRHMADGASATEIATWIVSPKHKKGVSRQYVYKMVEDRGDKTPVSTAKLKPRPKVVIRPSRKEQRR